ncbi:MAG: CBS domain-containing protein [Myxococcota bacterium]
MGEPKSKQPVERFMTATLHCIGIDQTLETAHVLMRKHQVRHLPVLEGGKLVGMVSERDLALVESLPGVERDAITVEEAMSVDVFTVSPEAPLSEVASQMAENKFGSAVVANGDKVLGVFTTTDALRALVI